MTSLSGIKIIEIAGIGPAPFCGMMLADHGAEVIRVERPNPGLEALTPREKDILLRGRRSIVIDLKAPEGTAILKQLSKNAHGLIEGFRPGVMERLGLGPDVLLRDNPGLVYGRVTGWGQQGPLAQTAGHDINYISLSGNLHTYGRKGEKPVPPVNVVGDYAGGAMYLAFGMLAGILSAKETGKGQVIDAAMIDGAASLASLTWTMHNAGMWSGDRGTNLLDTGSHFYETYETADGKWISLGAIEPQFYAEFRQLAGLADDPEFDDQLSPTAWPKLKDRLVQMFRSKTQKEWCETLEGTETCFAPILSLDEAPVHPHNQARDTFAQVNDQWQPAPAPRFSSTRPIEPAEAEKPGVSTNEILAELGYSQDQMEQLSKLGVIRNHH